MSDLTASPTQMSNSLRTVNLLIDVTSGQRILNVRSRTFVNSSSLVWTKNDTYLLNISLVTPQESDDYGLLWRYVEIPPSVVRAAWGRIGLLPEAGEWRLHDPDSESFTPYLAVNASAEDVQAAVRSLTGYESATVTGTVRTGFIINRGTTGEIAPLEVDAVQLSPRSFGDVVPIQQGSGTIPAIVAVYLEQQPAAYGNEFTSMLPASASVQEVQPGGSGSNAVYRLVLDPEPYGGTFRIGCTTPAGSGFSTSIDYNADPSQVEDALFSMANVGDGNVSVRRSGASNSQWDIEFVGDLANTAITGFTVDVASLLVPIGVTGLLNFGDTAVKELLRTQGSGGSVTGMFEVEIKPILGAPITPYRAPNSTVYDDLIRGDQTVPAPRDSYPTTPEMVQYVEGQIDDLREEIDDDLAYKADIDLANVDPVTGRDALGLGDSATRDIGTSSGTVAAGDDARIVQALRPGDNVSELTNDAGYIPDSQKGSNNGVATLDSGGKVPAAQLPNSVMEYHGNWNAATNTPALANGTGNAGDTYRCSVAGTANFGAGAITFNVGDFVIYSGTIWERSINSNEVVSVNGKRGVVTGLVESVGGVAPDGNGSIANLNMTTMRLPGGGEGYIDSDTTIPIFQHASPFSWRGRLAATQGAAAGSIAYRGAGGRTSVGDPTQSTHAANKGYVDNGLSQKADLTDPRIVNALQPGDSVSKLVAGPNTNDGHQRRVPVFEGSNGGAYIGQALVSASSSIDTLVMRSSNGNIRTALTPVLNNEAASKQYVDNGLKSSMPVGSGIDWWGTELPDNTWAWGNGQAISRTTYAALFAIFGTRYGAGNGTTTFNLPDKRERVSVGKSDMGGTTSQALIDKTVNAIDPDILGNKGGTGQVALTAAQNGPHAHLMWPEEDGENLGLSNNPSGGAQTYSTGGREVVPFGPYTESSGSGDNHANTQPSIVCNYIIKVLPS